MSEKEGMYTPAEIIAAHVYHCVDCLWDEIDSGNHDCGCTDEAVKELKQKRDAEGWIAADRLWAEHVAWAIEEYAG